MPTPTREKPASPCPHQSWLSTQLATSVLLTWTENRSLMLSTKGDVSAGYAVRLHGMFRQAPAAVWQALVVYIRTADPAARRTLQAYIRGHRHLIRAHPKRPRPVPAPQPRGRHFDLEVIYHELNQAYFANGVQARITWSRRPPQRARTSIRFGSYCARDRLIRIHRLLDQPFVPRYVIESVIFHEMLHQLIPRRRAHGRWCVHPPEFRQHERRFPYYQQAEQWQRQHLSRLLRG